jgi:outer membrane protein
MQNPIRILVLAALAAGGAAQAQNHTLKLGVTRYDTHAKTTGITGVGIPPGADATVGDATTALLTYEYALSPQVGLELVLGVPPKIKAQASGSVAFLGEVMTARNVAPTLFLTYHFGTAADTIRPYAGLGVNYTRFTDVKSPYGWDVSLSDSVGLAAHVGVDWRLGKQWGLWASLGAVDVRSRLVATGATVLQTTIDFRPLTYSAGALFRF